MAHKPLTRTVWDNLFFFSHGDGKDRLCEAYWLGWSSRSVKEVGGACEARFVQSFSLILEVKGSSCQVCRKRKYVAEIASKEISHKTSAKGTLEVWKAS